MLRKKALECTEVKAAEQQNTTSGPFLANKDKYWMLVRHRMTETGEMEQSPGDVYWINAWMPRCTGDTTGVNIYKLFEGLKKINKKSNEATLHNNNNCKSIIGQHFLISKNCHNSQTFYQIILIHTTNSTSAHTDWTFTYKFNSPVQKNIKTQK